MVSALNEYIHVHVSCNFFREYCYSQLISKFKISINLFCKLLNNFQILAETFHQTEHSFKSKVLKIGYPIILLLTWYKRQVIVLNILYFEKSTIFKHEIVEIVLIHVCHFVDVGTFNR